MFGLSVVLERVDQWVASRTHCGTHPLTLHRLRLLATFTWLVQPLMFVIVLAAVAWSGAFWNSYTARVPGFIVVNMLVACAPVWVTRAPAQLEQRLQRASWAVLAVLWTALIIGISNTDAGFASPAAITSPVFGVLSLQLVGSRWTVTFLGPVVITTCTIAFWTSPSRLFNNQVTKELWTALFMYTFFAIFLLHSRYIHVWRALVEEQQRTTRRTTKYMSLLSHELRTPLQGIVGVMELLKHTPNVHGDIINALQASVDSIIVLHSAMRDQAFQTNSKDSDWVLFEPQELLRQWKQTSTQTVTTMQFSATSQPSLSVWGYRPLLQLALARLTAHASHSGDGQGHVHATARIRDDTTWGAIREEAHAFAGDTLADSTLHHARDASHILQIDVTLPVASLPHDSAGNIAHLFELTRQSPEAADRLHHGGGLNLDLFAVGSAVTRMNGVVGWKPTPAEETGIVVWLCVPVTVVEPSTQHNTHSADVVLLAMDDEDDGNSDEHTDERTPVPGLVTSSSLSQAGAPQEMELKLLGGVTTPTVRDSLSMSTLSDAASERVLVVDDTAMNRSILKDMLRLMGHQCEEAADGMEAAELFQKHLDRHSGSARRPRFFDIIIMDIQMPRMNGFDTARQLRKLGCECPIVAWSAGCVPSDVTTAREAGMQGYYKKPLGMSQLQAVITEHVRKPQSWLENVL